MPPSTTPEPVFTAGVGASVQQTPLADHPFRHGVRRLEHRQPPGRRRAGHRRRFLTLYELNDTGGYDATGMTTTTDANGYYQFTGLLPGTYRVVETQPEGYLSVGDTAGTVNGATRGVVTTVDILSSINLDGGDNSIDNDFCRSGAGHDLRLRVSGWAGDRGQTGRPAAVYSRAPHGHPYARRRALVRRGAATLRRQRRAAVGFQRQQITTVTDANGYYQFDMLYPGVYSIVEIPPSAVSDRHRSGRQQGRRGRQPLLDSGSNVVK